MTALTQVTDTRKNKGSTTRVAYPAAGQTQMADANTDLSKAVADVPHTTYTVDSTTRVTNVTDPAGNSRSTSYTPFEDVASAQSAEGGLSSGAFNANGGESLTQATSATGAGTSIAYANPATSTNPTGNFQPSSSTDPQGNASTFTYNGTGNRISSSDASAAKATVDYNDDGTVKSTTDPANGTNSTTYQYDPTKQLTTITPPTGNSLGVRHFTYDGFGRLRTIDNGTGAVTTYEYDNDDRTTTVSYSDDNTHTVTFTYDGAGNMTTRVDGTGTTTVEYDALNRLIHRTAPEGGTLSYEYDPAGNLKKLTDGRGSTTYTYDKRNLLTSMTTAQYVRYAFDYDKDGRRTTTWFNTNDANTTWTARTTQTYDGSGRLTRTATARNSNPDDTVYDVSYCYTKHVDGQGCATTGDTGLRQWQTDNRTGAVSVFSFDTSNRLTKATNYNGADYSYAYDADGNITSTTTVQNGITSTRTFTYNSANQMTNDNNEVTPGYDGAGNRTGHQPDAFGYNAANQLTLAICHVDQGSARGAHPEDVQPPNCGVDRYRYAGPTQNEVVNITHNLGDKSGQNLVYGLPDSSGTPWLQSVATSSTTWYIERDQGGDTLGLTLSDGRSFYYVLDGLGSVVNILGTDGSIAATYTYDPYGGGGTVDSNDIAQTNRLTYGGGLRGFHGQVKLGRRWYDTRTHAFVQQDSVNIIGNPQRGNRYSYAADNPVNNVDPTGALAVTVGAKVCYYICIGGGYSWDAEGNSAPYVSVGVGNPGVDAGSSLSTGNVESGLSGEIGCSAGFARASVNTSGEVSGGWGTDFSSGECDASAVYTF